MSIFSATFFLDDSNGVLSTRAIFFSFQTSGLVKIYRAMDWVGNDSNGIKSSKSIKRYGKKTSSSSLNSTAVLNTITNSTFKATQSITGNHLTSQSADQYDDNLFDEKSTLKLNRSSSIDSRVNAEEVGNFSSSSSFKAEVRSNVDNKRILTLAKRKTSATDVSMTHDARKTRSRIASPDVNGRDDVYMSVLDESMSNAFRYLFIFRLFVLNLCNVP